ncbi:hypothetical protein [Saccharospirillum mangrovi]|uniref:hypothetical protein n=1 Tax=Saccharospirillum mangrovi TaxID=2161747 RepID=UPI000D3B8C70|nr:hypothetical protein [Saccharospirillum mangrovi]
MPIAVISNNRHSLFSCLMLLMFWLSGCRSAYEPAGQEGAALRNLAGAASDQPPAIEPYLISTVGDAFGAAVAISADGQILAIGAPGEDSSPFAHDSEARATVNAGTVYLYQFHQGEWWPQATVRAADSESDDRFGTRLGLSADGTVLVVGAPYKDSVGRSQKRFNQGVAYVFRRHDSQWLQEAQLSASNADSFDEFASELVLSADGQTVAIAAPGEDSRDATVGPDRQQINAGAVYLFQHQDGEWREMSRFKAEPARLMDSFGRALSLSADGRVLAVGVDREDRWVDIGNNTQRWLSNSGAVYLYEQRDSDWSLASKIHPRLADSHDNFGAALSLNSAGTQLAVGAPGESGLPAAMNEANNEAPNAGAVYLFERGQDGWQQQAYVKAQQGEANDGFGSELQLSAEGNRLAVGAPWEDGDAADNNDAVQAGAVYVFDSNDAHWQQTAYLKADNIAAFDHFGKALALTQDGHQLVVGVEAEDAGLVDNHSGFQRGLALRSGAAYLFGQIDSNWQQHRYLKSAEAKARQLALY